MDWIDGKPLDQAFASIKELSVEEKNKIMTQLIDAQLVLNHKLAVHHDLHEGNILFDGSQIILIDPGNPSEVETNATNSISQYNKAFLKNVYNRIYTPSEKQLFIENWESLTTISAMFSDHQQMDLIEKKKEMVKKIIEFLDLVPVENENPGIPIQINKTQMLLAFFSAKQKEYLDYFNVVIHLNPSWKEFLKEGFQFYKIEQDTTVIEIRTEDPFPPNHSFTFITVLNKSGYSISNLLRCYYEHINYGMKKVDRERYKQEFKELLKRLIYKRFPTV